MMRGQRRSRRARGGWRRWVLVALGSVVGLLVGCGDERDRAETQSGGSAFLSLLGGEGSEGFERVTGPRPLEFPADHGEHPQHQIEWWYFTGNLESGGGERLGFELTFFRFALASDTPPSGSAWATRQLYLAHFAVTDLDAGTFFATERRTRGALGLAGVDASPWRAWNGDWEARSEGEGALFPLRLRASDRGHALDLRLDAREPMVLQGDRGYSRKGSEPGDASYYYSYPRIEVTGAVRTPARELDVTGSAWMDHEWSTSVLGGELVGWDWFAIHLDDGSELMAYQLRRRDGGIGEWSAGCHVDASGRATTLVREDFELEVLDTWTSPVTGASYPSQWRLKVPSRGLDLELRSALADQELRLSTVYWEGVIDVAGSHSGRGYAELVGYAD